MEEGPLLLLVPGQHALDRQLSHVAQQVQGSVHVQHRCRALRVVWHMCSLAAGGCKLALGATSNMHTMTQRKTCS